MSFGTSVSPSSAPSEPSADSGAAGSVGAVAADGVCTAGNGATGAECAPLALAIAAAEETCAGDGGVIGVAGVAGWGAGTLAPFVCALAGVAGVFVTGGSVGSALVGSVISSRMRRGLTSSSTRSSSLNCEVSSLPRRRIWRIYFAASRITPGSRSGPSTIKATTAIRMSSSGPIPKIPSMASIPLAAGLVQSRAQNAIHKTRAAVAAIDLGQFHRLIDHHLGRRITGSGAQVHRRPGEGCSGRQSQVVLRASRAQSGESAHRAARENSERRPPARAETACSRRSMAQRDGPGHCSLLHQAEGRPCEPPPSVHTGPHRRHGRCCRSQKGSAMPASRARLCSWIRTDAT